MRRAEVYTNGVLVGLLTETDDAKYIFKYDDVFLVNPTTKAISLTLPKRSEALVADELFPFFFNMLSEGANKALQCMTLKIDENDAFGLLLATAGNDTIGSITVKKI